MPSVAEVIVKVLEDEGIERVYGIPGDSIDPLVDAIRKSKSVKYVQSRHEEGSAFEASVEAKLSHKPSACMGTSGPGSIHLLNGLYDAKMDHAPVIAFTGQVESDMLGRDYFQEVDLVRLFDDVAVFNKVLVNPESAEYLVRRAIREARAKRGVAHINLPVDVLRKDAKYEGRKETFTPPIDYLPDFSKAIELINQSKKPVIMIGGGARGVAKELNDFAEKIGAPVIYALNGKGVLPDEDPKVMGGLGLLGSKPSVKAIDDADLLILLGTSFPYVSFLPKDTKVIQVDTDPSNIGKRVQVDVAFPVPIKDFLKIRSKVNEKAEKYYDKMRGSKEDWLKELSEQENDLSKPMRPQRVAYLVSQKCDDDATIVTDVGNVTMWTARHFRASGRQAFVFSSWLGSMGIGVPGGIGAYFARGKQTIVFAGDGGFTMTMMELITAKKYGVPIKVVVYNNSKLGMIKFEQEVMGYPEWGVDLYNPDFVKIAEAVGFKGYRMEDPRDESVIEEFLSTEGGAVLDAVVNPDERPMPPKLTFKQAEGYVISIFREKWQEITEGDNK
ncbi:thiamine pyrophosphate-dependent enzyme [Stygiolobus caldivivus]|uniref:2-oxoacid oxidoreductase (ferredoxin) n=1 Tax=Stygiolobus caldivivus TaxID=2824673 RepID=A0A8D5U6D5_9CREN|nr:thiamine pyrophosphate-dependent enzyme [Stygiolobus caldivivus]BCU69905.1 pyruvate oxidase [Stygiolobus caldivivus]